MNIERLPLKIDNYLEQAKNHISQQKWQLAIADCQRIIALCQGQISASTQSLTPESCLAQGDLFLAEGNLEAAMNQYRQVLALNPNIPQAYQRIAEICSKQGNWQQATAYYRQAVQLNQTSTITDSTATYGSYRQQGDLLRSQNKISEAIESYLQAIQLQPNSPELLANLGSLYAQQHQWQDAIAFYQKALELQPNFAGVYRNLSRVFQQINQPQLASQSWEKALELEPHRATLTEYLELAHQFQQQQNWQKAIAFYQHAIQLQPDSQDTYLHLNNCLKDFAQPEQAIAIYRQLIQQHPAQPEPLIYLGQIFSSQKKWLEASSIYQQLIQIQPNFWQAYLYLAEVKIQQRQWQEVISICRRALAIQSDVSWLHHNWGYAAFKLQHWQEAYQALLQAIKLNPNFTWSYFYLAESLVAQEEPEKAVRAYLAAIELDQDLPGVYKQLGMVLRQQFQADPEGVISKYQHHPPLSKLNQNSAFYCQLAANLVQKKQLSGAIIFYSLAAKLRRSLSEAEALRGLAKGEAQSDRLELEQRLQQVQQQQAQLEAEIQTLYENIQNKPQLPHLYTQLGNLLADLGEYQEAYRLHRQASVLRGWHLALENRNYQFQYDWFTHNIPVWQQHLEKLKQIDSINILEIGSFEGMATCWFLDYILTKELDHITCIDLYFQANFEYNLAQTGSINKVTPIAGNSHEILPTLAHQKYDLIYIDGSHLADDVKQDALLAWDLLKDCGLIIFDDYEFTFPENSAQNPKIGIEQFLATKSSQFHVIHQDYQLIIQKIKKYT
ncbi:TPR domain protein [Stanieria sp. NIES-3757]|nr:TPR domain protein [Stanieria sp. NIES-3757]